MATEVLESDTAPSRMMLMCDHASNHVPPEYDLSEGDRRKLETHWGWDPGAEALTRRLADLEDAPAVLSRFSRLLCDPNRRLDQTNLFRTHAIGEPIHLNSELSAGERERRLERFYHRYHQTVDERLREAVEHNPDLFLFSIHTFTPRYGDEVRQMEVGVLFDHGQHYAHDFAEALAEEGFEPALNEPYSGKEGLMYSVKRHGTNYGIRHLELEVRNDLLRSADDVDAIARPIYRALEDAVLVPTPGNRVPETKTTA